MILESACDKDVKNTNILTDSKTTQEGQTEGQEVIDEADHHDNVITSGNEADGEEVEEYESDSSDEPSGTSAPSTGKKKARRGLPIKLVKKKKGSHAKKKKTEKTYKPGDKIPTEIIYSRTQVEVMWQVISQL